MKRREVLGHIATSIGVAAVGNSTAVCAQSVGLATVKQVPTVAPPDPMSKTPVFKAPSGSCDTHCHIFGPAAQYPYSPKRSYTPPDSGLEDFQLLHAKLGIDRAVIVNASLYGSDNCVVTDAIAQSGGRYRGIANVFDANSL